jgi:hypothetical protein
MTHFRIVVYIQRPESQSSVFKANVYMYMCVYIYIYIYIYIPNTFEVWMADFKHRISCNGCSEDGERCFHFEVLNGEDGLYTGWR